MTKKEFIEELAKLGIVLTEDQEQKLEHFYNLLLEWNQKINLTRIIEKEDVYLKHFYDSLTIVKVIDLNKVETLCDVGSGAGFPRVNYLNTIIKELNLTEIKAIHTRSEDLKEKYDVVTARAVANISKLTSYTMHLLKKDGQLIAMKGDIEKELTKEVYKELNSKYKIVKIEEFTLPKENSKRSIIIITNK